MYTNHIPQYAIIALMFVAAVIFMVHAIKRTMSTTVDHKRHTPEPQVVRPLYRPYDWANPINKEEN